MVLSGRALDDHLVARPPLRRFGDAARKAKYTAGGIGASVTDLVMAPCRTRGSRALRPARVKTRASASDVRRIVPDGDERFIAWRRPAVEDTSPPIAYTSFQGAGP